MNETTVPSARKQATTAAALRSAKRWCSATALLIAGTISFPASAPAATWFWGPTEPTAEVPIQHKRVRPRPRPKEPVMAEKDKPVGPLIITIAIQQQKLRLYDSRGLFAESPVSTGMPGHATPMGVFSVIEKQKWHRSNIYSGAPMPYMQRITWSGVAMHQGVLPGYPASHGCIRMPAAFAIKLWGWTQRGARVIITPGEISPAEFAHPKLIAQMLPEPDLAETSAPARTAEQSQPLKAGEKFADRVPQAVNAAPELRLATLAMTVGSDRDPVQAADKALPATDASSAEQRDEQPDSAAGAAQPTHAEATADRAKDRADDPSGSSDAPSLETAKDAEPTVTVAEPKSRHEDGAPPQPKADAAQAAAAPEPAAISPDATTAPADPRDVPTVIGPKRTGHLAVFISRKERRLYVRQNFAPVFDVPVEITDPDKPIGTFVFTARGDGDDAKALHWSVVTMPFVTRKTVASAPARHGKPGRTISEPTLGAPPVTAAEALDRITIPPAALERIAQTIKPGGSLVISDHGLGDETGLGTDFIVPLR